MEGNRTRGRQMISDLGMIDALKKRSYIRTKRRAENRVAWRCWMTGTCLRAENY